MARDVGGRGRFVDLRTREAGGERLERCRRGVGHAGSNRAGIDAAREENADRHIGNHMLPNRPEETFAGLVDPLRLGDSRPWRDLRRPEAPGDAAEDADRHGMPREQSPNLSEDRSRAEDMAKAEKVADSLIVHIEFEAGKNPESRDLGRKCDAALLLGVEQRLDAEGIASERQGPREMIPDRDRIHSFETQPDVFAPFQEPGEQCFDVAAGAESEAALQLTPQLEMIDDLAVADDRIAAVRAGNRLVTMFDVDDAETPHAEAEVVIDEIPGVVRSLVHKMRALFGNDILADGAAHAPVPACNPAHGSPDNWRRMRTGLPHETRSTTF